MRGWDRVSIASIENFFEIERELLYREGEANRPSQLNPSPWMNFLAPAPISVVNMPILTGLGMKTWLKR